MKLKYLILSSVFMMSSSFANNEFESAITHYHWHNTECFLYANNIGVMLKNNSNMEIGQQTYLLHNNACYLPKGVKPITKFKLTQFYLGKKGKDLFFDNGSSPDFRQLKIYDLHKGKFIFVDNYVDGLKFESNNTVEYWQEVQGNQDLSICKDKDEMLENGLKPLIVEKVQVDYSSSDYMRKVYSHKPKCTYVQ